MKKRNIVIISIVAALLLAAVIFGLVAVIIMQRDFDYMKDDLSKYIEISENDYKNYDIELYFDEVTDKDVERKIMALLYQNRDKEPQYNGGNVTNLPISVGDKVHFYYRGYTVGENGRETDLENASNLLGDISTLEIGSLSFIPGFEESLIGINPKDYTKLELETEGTVQPGDVIYLSYSAMLPSGKTVQKVSERIDLSASGIDALYGLGFKDYFEGVRNPDGKGGTQKEIGKKISESVTFAYDGGSAVYFDMTVTHAQRAEQNVLTIDAHFPADYQEKSLRGLDVKFDVYIKYINVYNTPEYNEKFITDTLKLTAEELSTYSGETLAEKHREYLRALAKEENEEACRTLTEEAMWEYYHTKVRVKKLPQADVNEVYKDYYDEVLSTYEAYYSSAYDSVDKFAKDYFGLASGESWIEHITKKAEKVIVEKLIFYYIIREEKLVPSEEEFDSLYNGAVEEYLGYYADNIYKSELESLKTEEERQKRLAEIKDEMLDYYGEEYFAEIVYYDYALDDIISFANVKRK